MLTGIKWLDEVIKGIFGGEYIIAWKGFLGARPGSIFAAHPPILAFVHMQHWMLGEHILCFIHLIMTYFNLDAWTNPPSVCGVGDQLMLLLHWIRHLASNLTSALRCCVTNSTRRYLQPGCSTKQISCLHLFLSFSLSLHAFCAFYSVYGLPLWENAIRSLRLS